MSARDLALAGGAAPAAAGARSGGAAAAPRDGVELRLVRIWEEVLGRREVGRDDDFFSLGGDGEAAARVAARLADELAVALPPAVLVEAPTVERLAARVVERAAGDPDAWLVDVARDGELPLAPVQEDLGGPGAEDAALPHRLVLRLAGDLSAPALAAALAAIVGRHEALRTTFDRLGGRPVQVIHHRSHAAPSRVDLAGLPAARRRAERQRLEAAAAGRPFDPVRGPLHRFTLVRLEAGEHLQLADFHPLIFDHGSRAVVVRELAALYRAAVAGEPSPLAPPAIQYADFAVWQREWLAAEGEGAERGKGAYPAALVATPVRHPAGRHPFAVPAALAARLLERARGEGADLAAVLVAALAAALHRRDGRERILVGLAVPGRDRPELDGLIGRFATTRAIAADLSGDPSLRALLGRVGGEVQAAAADPQASYAARARREPARSGGGSPAPAVLLQLPAEAPGPVELPGLTVSLEPAAPAAAAADLALELEEREDELTGAWTFRAGRFDRDGVAALGDDFLDLLAALADDPDRRLSSLPAAPAGGGQERNPPRKAPAAAPPAPILVRLHPGGRRPPLVLVHGAGGGVLIYGELARRLGEHRPVYALESPEPAAGASLPGSLEEIAAGHVDRLLASDLGDPFRLGGWSMGGVLALAIAQRLLAGGGEVALVALFDSWLPAAVAALEGVDHEAALWVGFARSLGLPLSALAAARDRMLAAASDRGRLAALLEAAQRASLLPAAWTVDRLERRFRFHRAHIEAFRAYRPARYPGRVLLFQAELNVGEAGMVEQEAGWRQVAAGGIEAERLPADHLGLFQPPAVTLLAAGLEARLAALEEASPPAVAAAAPPGADEAAP